ncbi:MAG TPA: hypothetical protein DIV86_03580 [Alphaproteobacteria bacterium]|nr:hypothetical protein [Alphaproteobacteria bacterium]
MDNLVTYNATYFNFENSLYLLVIVLCPIIFYLEYNIGRKSFYSLQKLRKFVDVHLIKYVVSKGESKRKAYFRLTCLFFFIIFSALALSNPRWDFTEIESYRPNSNIIFLIDISNSMLAEDEKPSRLDRAKQEISDIMNNIENANFGLIAFAHQAHVISPVTNDKENLNFLLPSVTSDIVSIQGSNIVAALKAANNLAKVTEGSVNYFIILSDGGFESLAELPKNDKKVQIISYGLGTLEGAPIPDEKGSFIKQGDKVVLSKLEQKKMEYIAGGRDNYIKATYLDDDIEKLKSKILAQTIIEKSKYSNLRVWNDRFYIFIILAMLAISPFFARGAKFPIVILMILSFSSSSKAEDDKKEDLSFLNISNIEYNFFNNQNEQAVIDFQNKKYKKAAKKLSSHYNKGVAYYRDKNFEKAEENFSNAGLSKAALYNLGNSQLRQLKLEDAIISYEEVLKKDENHKDTKFNLEIAKKMLERQNQEQKKNEQDKRSDRDKQNDDQQQNQKTNDAESGDKNSNDDKKSEHKEEKTQIDFGNSKEDSKKKDSALIKKQGELEMKAEKIFKKINSNPEKLMKNRFMMEEKKLKQQKIDVMPW